jgi:hypothetical protein
MQHDRFAREIIAILAFSDAARLRRLMRNSLGGQSHITSPNLLFVYHMLDMAG